MNNHDKNRKAWRQDGIKLIALAILVLQNASLVLVMRYSHLNPIKGSPLYLASTAVFMGEVLKILVSLMMLLNEHNLDVSKTINSALACLKLLAIPKELMSLSVPALLYVMQNNLVYVANANLDPAPFQLLFQLKIFTTAILSVLLLNKVLSRDHWKSLGVLFVGVFVVQLSTLEDSKASVSSNEQRPMVGLGAILVAVTCSGLSGVWFERILKGSVVSLWLRNIQLAVISLVLAGFSVYLKDFDQVVKHDFFGGYNSVVWLVILLQGGGGIVVALVVKYADNILKGFATSIATVLSTVASIYWFDFHVSSLFIVGAALVLGSAYMYNAADTVTPRTATAIKIQGTEKQVEGV